MPRLRAIAVLLAAVTFMCAAVASAASPPAVLMRFANVGTDRIAFVAYGDLWTVPLTGGMATRLTSDAGQVLVPHFSPDGRSIAFTWRREGGSDVYVIPAGGGTPKRLTHGPTLDTYDNVVTGWTPNGKNILFVSVRAAALYHQYETFSVPVSGGLAVSLRLGHSGTSSLSPDGRTLAFDRSFRDLGGDRWKGYRGGQAPDIWTMDLSSRALERVTRWPGIDTAPMWVGRQIFFLSDRGPERRANIWSVDLDTRTTRQLTRFTDLDIDKPSVGPGGIAFQQGGSLYRLDPATGASRKVRVEVPDDGRMARRQVSLSRFASRSEFTAAGASSAILAARGDLVQADRKGGVRNLTGTSTIVEARPSISPDGGTLAFITDRGGNQQVAVMPVAGGPARSLTRFTSGYLYTPRWSSNGARLVVADAQHGLWLVDAARGGAHRVATDPFAEIRDARLSADANWLAYSKLGANQLRAIHLYEVATGRDIVISAALEDDHDPVFSADGRRLYFVSRRHERPFVSDRDREGTVASLKSDGLYSVALPIAAPSGEGGSAAESWSNLTAAAVEVGAASPGGFADLEVVGDALFYRATAAGGLSGDLPGEVSTLRRLDLKTAADRVVADDVDGFALALGGGTAIARRQGGWEIVQLNGNIPPERLDLSRATVSVDPRAETRVMFEQAWRLYRDLFWDPKMNGVDWSIVHRTYARLVPLVGSHEDLIYMLGEMQGELSTSHMFVGGGDRGDPRASIDTALLGVDFAPDAAIGRFSFARIYRGDPSRARFRAPLGDASLDVREGDLLLAIGGQQVRLGDDPFAFLLGKSGKVALTVARGPGGSPRTVEVDTIEDESEIRKLDWIERNRASVDRLSGGAIGYLYLSDFNGAGAEDLLRQFYAQTGKQGLVIDLRGNTGGFTSQWVLDLLRRPLAGGFLNRNNASTTLPGAVAPRALVVITDEFSMSDGDQFPYFFRKWSMGPVVGRRTWGGVRGVKGPWSLSDGTFVTVPKDALRDAEGHLIIENEGSSPDVDVDLTPHDLASGNDPQLEAAVRAVLGGRGGIDGQPPPKP